MPVYPMVVPVGARFVCHRALDSSLALENDSALNNVHTTQTNRRGTIRESSVYRVDVYFVRKKSPFVVSSFHRKRSPSLSEGGYKYDVTFCSTP